VGCAQQRREYVQELLSDHGCLHPSMGWTSKCLSGTSTYVLTHQHVRSKQAANASHRGHNPHRLTHGLLSVAMSEGRWVTCVSLIGSHSRSSQSTLHGCIDANPSCRALHAPQHTPHYDTNERKAVRVPHQPPQAIRPIHPSMCHSFKWSCRRPCAEGHLLLRAVQTESASSPCPQPPSATQGTEPPHRSAP